MEKKKNAKEAFGIMSESDSSGNDDSKNNENDEGFLFLKKII